ncbi:MAG: thioredoxin [Proteobacteria bacterium]|nr:MAG: thioredoxin [Pseudomonadota bacterium]
MAGANVHEFTDANFEAEVLQSDLPVLVDFWAIWCGPCRAIAPIVDQIADEFAGKLKVGKVDTDKNERVAGSLGISSIPAVFVFKHGEVVERIVGARPKASFIKALTPHL